jgi:4-amino-4-deoxy-L-arabinose transferase-like glycosyltransferase
MTDRASSSTLPADRWLAAAVAALAFAGLWPTLGRFRLLDADELTHARAAWEAARDGHWLPLNLGGLPWSEKPPLLPWATALLMRAFGPVEPVVRFWPLALACAALGLGVLMLRRLGASRWAALAAAALLLSQRDWLYHARFLSMDSGLLACLLGALLAWDPRRPWRSGLWLGLAAALKSWFAMALLPAFSLALLAAGTEERRAFWRALAWPVAVLALWLAAYALAYGPAFLGQEWSVNLWGRISGQGHPASAPPLSFYSGWARLFFPAALACGPLALGQAWRDRRDWRRWPFLRRAGVGFLLSWGLGLLLVRVTVFHYLLPWGAVAVLLASAAVERMRLSACLLWGLAWAGLAWMAPQTALPHAAVWALGLACAGLGLIPASPRPLAWKSGVLVAAAVWGFSGGGGAAYWQAPPDPNGPLVAGLLAHPAPLPGAALEVQGPRTQAIDFYSLWKPTFVDEGRPLGHPGIRYDAQRVEFMP